MATSDVEPEVLESIKAAFKNADLNGDGYISKDELHSVFNSIGQWTDEEFDELYAAADTSQDGKLSYDEFLDWVLSQDEETFTVQVAGVETTLIEFGSNGAHVRRLSQKPLAEVESILLVIDPRALPNVVEGLASIGSDEALAAKVTSFVLMPSMSSAPEFLMCAEVGLQFLNAPHMPMGDVRVVRIDDYMRQGEAVLVAMMEGGKKVYPAEEVEAMLGFFKQDSALGYTEEEETTPECSRFVANVYNYRAWCHWVVGMGSEEGEIMPAQQSFSELLADDNQALARIDVESMRESQAFLGRAVAPVLLAFNEASAAKFTEAFGTEVFACLSMEEENMNLRGCDIEELPQEQRDVLTEQDIACLRIVSMEENEEEGWDVGDEEEGIPEGELRKQAREEAGIEDPSSYLSDINNRIKASCGRIGGMPVAEAIGGLFGPDATQKYAILLVDPEDLAVTTENFLYKPTMVAFLNKYRESYPDHCIMAVLFDEDFSKFAENKFLALAIHQLVENADATLFATQAETPQVAGFLFGAKHPTEHIVHALCMQQVPFPRLHFFTLSTAMGQDLEDGEILTPAVTVGPQVAGLPVEKFSFKNRFSPFFLTDAAFQPLTERLVLGTEDAVSATLIQPAKLLQTIFTNAIPSEESWVDRFGEGFEHFENAEIVESGMNCSDLAAEYEQYNTVDTSSKVPIES
mmetsp:Transcript_133685/g.260313  ORF Transcript_133685/g.260313 Transcript_133685/m.260313 type:complete len:691 (-) Transcript_133685:205-2277(-)